MRALSALTVANIKSFIRDRAALFWTVAFPLIFILLFGFIFQGGGDSGLSVAWADEDGTPASAQLRTAFEAAGTELTDAERDAGVAEMQAGDVDTVIVVPAGYGDALAAAAAGSGPSATVIVYTDPSRESLNAAIQQTVAAVLGAVNLGGRPPLVTPAPETVQTEELNFISYFVPSVLAMSIMQLGIFASIPLVADREKGILKRLAATPLRRSQLVGSNVNTRLLIALVQSVVIVGVGAAVFGVEVTGPWLLSIAFIVLGAVAFLALGYVLASFAKTEEAVNGLTSVVQFPMMFLSGVFFPIDQMPDFLQTIARFIPLTYLADALRQVMVGGTAFAPLWVCFAVLAGWLVTCFAISSRSFRWQ